MTDLSARLLRPETDRRIVLMRHAKSAWDEGGLDDHSRPLTERGRGDARRIADRLAERGWVPDRVLASDAARTVETWGRMAERLPEGIDVLQTRRLYLAGIEAFCSVVAEQPDHVRTLLVLGHNPGWEEVARRLTGLPIGMGTATAALLRRVDDVSWRRAPAAHAWDLVDVLRTADRSPC